MEHTGLFTPQIMQLVRSGELAGNLPEMLTQASTFEREEAKHLGKQEGRKLAEKKAKRKHK